MFLVTPGWPGPEDCVITRQEKLVSKCQPLSDVIGLRARAFLRPSSRPVRTVGTIFFFYFLSFNFFSFFHFSYLWRLLVPSHTTGQGFPPGYPAGGIRLVTLCVGCADPSTYALSQNMSRPQSLAPRPRHRTTSNLASRVEAAHPSAQHPGSPPGAGRMCALFIVLYRVHGNWIHARSGICLRSLTLSPPRG